MEHHENVMNAYTLLDARFVALRQKMTGGEDSRLERLEVEQSLTVLEECGQNVEGLRQTLRKLFTEPAADSHSSPVASEVE